MSSPVMAGTPGVLEGNPKTLSAWDASASLLCLFMIGGCGPSGGFVGRTGGEFHEWSTPCLMTATMRQGRDSKRVPLFNQSAWLGQRAMFLIASLYNNLQISMRACTILDKQATISADSHRGTSRNHKTICHDPSGTWPMPSGNQTRRFAQVPDWLRN